MVQRVAFMLVSGLTLAALSSAASPVDFLAGAPTCAKVCPALTSAQSTCNSQAAGAALTTIASCFCTNAQATNLRTDPSVCSSSCTTAADADNAMQWFAAFCAAPQTITAVAAAAATQAPIVSGTTATGTAAAATASATSTGGVSANAYDPNEQGSWWSQHKGWIAMVIVLIVVFSLIIIFGILWKRRHTRKRNERNRMSPTAIWGPQQSHPHSQMVGPSAAVLAANRDAEKGEYYEERPVGSRVQSDMSTRRGASQSSHGRRSSRGGGRRKKLGEVFGR